MKILLADQLAPIVLSSLEECGHQIKEETSLKDTSLLKALEDFKPEILVVRSTKVTTEHIKKSPSLSLIIRAGAGVNTIALDTASEHGVFVANCPGKNAIAVAELVMGHIISIDRHLYENINDFRNGIWNKKKYSKSEGLYGKTIAILGMGAIGQEVAKRAQAFGMHVKGWSRSLGKLQAEEWGIECCESPIEAAADAHILTVHLPSNKDTKDILDAKVLGVLKKGAYVINTSRGALLDEEAMKEALSVNNIKFGLDVFKDEPAASEKSVSTQWMEEENIYVSHHIGASTNQATEAVGLAILNIIDTWEHQGLVLNCVNLAKQTKATCCLSVRHADKVGVLANVLNHVRADGLNIQEMDNTIFQGGKAACARIFLVGTPSEGFLLNLQDNLDIFACSVS
jgi:D-3-phosphoglycerate dehydrogenase